MISNPLKFALVGLAVVVGAAGVALVHLDSSRLRQRVADARRQKEQVDRLREDNRQAQELLARSKADADGGARAIHEDVVRLRAEVSELEQRAEATRAKKLAQAAADATALESNRDPEKALTRLEHFRNVGQGTPSAAFQSFVWAAMNGEDAALAGMIAFAGAGRAKAEAVVAALPESVREKYPTPEKLAALFFADVLTATTAAQIVDVSFSDAQHAVVTVRGLTDKPQKVPLQFGAFGWQISVPEGMTGKLDGWVRGASRLPPPE